MDIRVPSVIQTYQRCVNAKQYVTSTTFITDCWSAYRDLDSNSYTHQNVNHLIGFDDMRTGAHMNTIESTWQHVKAFLNPYNRMGDYIYHLARYVFAARYQSDKVNHFTKFIGINPTMEWSATPPLHRGLVAI
jgi:hypothetical protein